MTEHLMPETKELAQMKQTQWWHREKHRARGSRGWRALKRQVTIYQHAYNGARWENTHSLSQRCLICI